MKLRSKLTSKNTLVLQCEETRSQHQNKKLVLDRFWKLLSEGLQEAKPRKKSKPTKASILKRLQQKKSQGLKKEHRKKPNLWAGIQIKIDSCFFIQLSVLVLLRSHKGVPQGWDHTQRTWAGNAAKGQANCLVYQQLYKRLYLIIINLKLRIIASFYSFVKKWKKTIFVKKRRLSYLFYSYS